MTRTRRVLVLGASALIVLLGACGDDGGSADTTAVPVTTAAGPPVFVRTQTSIAVPLGRTFIIELASNATTGYAWEPNIEPGASIEMTTREYVAPNTSAVGAGGVEHFTFSAVHAGTTQLTFEYRRSFEPATTPAVDSATFTITVTG